MGAAVRGLRIVDVVWLLMLFISGLRPQGVYFGMVSTWLCDGNDVDRRPVTSYCPVASSLQPVQTAYSM